MPHRRNKEDPTGQGRNRLRGRRILRRRLGIAQRITLEAFRAIPRTRRTRVDIAPNRTFYEYDISATELAQLNELIMAGLDLELLETRGDQPVPFWYWEPVIEKSYRQGTIREANTINDLIVAAVISGALIDPGRLDVQQILFTEPYRDAVAKHVGENFRSIKGLSDNTAKQVMGVISNGIQAGQTPTEITAAIRKRFSVAGSAADRIVNTEINKAYTDAKMRTGRLAAERLGVRTAVLHISALLPTTRDTHASRHGHTYTIEAQLSWWNSGANRINCHCDVSTVLVNRKGVIIDKRLQEALASERVFFQTERAA